MNDKSPPPSEKPAEPSTRYDSKPPATSSDSGCAFVGGVIAGFVLFLICGFGALSISNGGLAIAFLVVAFVVAVVLAMKPGFRGLAVGIFLGLGCVLLLIAICSGFRIGG